MENETTEQNISTTLHMEVTDPETGPNDNPKNNNLSEEMKMMENRLYESLKTLLKDTINISLKLIQESIDKLQATQTTMETQKCQILKLQCDNAILTEEVMYLRSEVNEFQVKINKLEDKSLENNLIFHGLEEQSPDDIDSRNEKIYAAISSTINRDTPEERLQVAREVEIVRTRRLGKAEPNRTRPLSIDRSSGSKTGKTGMSGMSGKTGMSVITGCLWKVLRLECPVEHTDGFLEDLLAFYA